MSDFVNTVDLVGDAALTDSIIDRSITEFFDNRLTKIDVSGLEGCDALRTVSMPELIVVSNSAFKECASLTDVYFPMLETVYSNAFFSCSSLKRIDLPSATTIGINAFLYSTPTVLILRSPVVCSLEGNPGFGSSTKVYVPSALVDDYKAATNWSAIANQIVAIEDYPDITGGAA